MNKSYKRYESKYNTTTPIRGRSVDVRPIGRRRRDWETITTKDVEGGKSYCAKLYKTECVEYFPNGDVTLRCDQWATPTTAEFIWEHSPFKCVKRHNKLWIENKGQWLPIKGDLRMQYISEGDEYKPYEEIIIQQRVVDRELAKAARAPLMPFLKFGESFLKMSDGWLMHETRMQVGVEKNNWGGYRFSKLESHTGDRYSWLYNYIATCGESEYLYLLCHLLHDINNISERRLAVTEMKEMTHNGGTFTRKMDYYDARYSQSLLRGRVFSIAKQAKDIYKIVEVKPSERSRSNTV